MGFQEVYGVLPQASAQAPGRVNLLGEHTDYQEGYVLPTPIPYFTRVEAAPLEGAVEAFSENLGELRARPLSSPPQGDFLDYLLGVVRALREAGHEVAGARFYVRSDLPMGAGLSSSAALEVAALRALRTLYRLPLSDLEVARLAQKAEVEYVGVRCGIMDQMAASLGQPGQALFLDTRTLAYENLPLPPGVRVAVLDLGLGRRLAEAGYNRRRQEAEEAAKALVALGPKAVLLKGGHLEGEEAVDLLATRGGVLRFSAPRVHTRNTHGTGCTLSAAIAALLAKGRPLAEAVAEAKAYLTRALKTAPSLGHGHGPLDHWA